MTILADERDPLTGKVIQLAIEVHREIGPGLLESSYEECLCYELGNPVCVRAAASAASRLQNSTA